VFVLIALAGFSIYGLFRISGNTANGPRTPVVPPEPRAGLAKRQTQADGKPEVLPQGAGKPAAPADKPAPLPKPGIEPPGADVKPMPLPPPPQEAEQPAKKESTAPKDVPLPPLPEVKPRKQFVVWHRQGAKQWKEVFFLDENGNVVSHDVQRYDPPPPVPQVGAQPPQPAPRTPPAAVNPKKLR